MNTPTMCDACNFLYVDCLSKDYPSSIPECVKETSSKNRK